MPRKKTIDDFIAESKSIHGENRYTYEHAVYIGAREPITLTCPEHGDFTVRADNHLCRGTGCPECAKPAKMENLALGPVSRLDHSKPNKYQIALDPSLKPHVKSTRPKARLLKEREAERMAANALEPQPEVKPEPQPEVKPEVKPNIYKQPYSGSAGLFW